MIVIYLDNILIYSKSNKKHVLHVKCVLQHLLSHGFYVKAEKYEFYKTELSFLSY